MRTYSGWRDENYTAHVVVQQARRAPRRLRLRLGLANHSPTGFEWGYAGSGPAQLALALLADALGDDARALRLHQEFKFRVVTRLPRNGRWTMTDVEVRAHANDIDTERARESA